MITQRKTPVLCLLLMSCGVPDASTRLSIATPELARESTRGEQPPVDALTMTATVGRVLIRDAQLTYEYNGKDDQRALRTRVIDSAAKLGGYVAGEYEDSLVIRVPSASLDAALKSLDGLGKVSKKSVTVEEVTAQHTDLTIRIDNARRLRARLQGLLADAHNVKDMLEVEKELARVTEELERFEGQLRSLDNRVALSTLTIAFEQTVRPGPVGWVFYGLFKGVKWLFVWD